VLNAQHAPLGEDPEETAEFDLDDDAVMTAANRIGRRVPDLIVQGIHERDILAMAPAMTCDRVYWSTVEDFDVSALLPELGMRAFTRRWSDGQHRLWVQAGEGYRARDLVRQWCQDHGVEAVNIRVETNVPFRDLDSIPGSLVPDLIAACVDWLYPRTYSVRRRLMTELDLVNADDVRSMMYLFVHDHADRFDADREGRNGRLNFTAFMFGKVRTWPQDAVRAAYGRTLVGDRLILHRVADDISAREGRLPSEVERADALGVSVTELRRREESINALASVRNYRSIWDEETEDGREARGVRDEIDVSEEATTHGRDAALTRALLDAVMVDGAGGRKGCDPLALAATYLTYWEGLNRTEVAQELEILPKTASAALNRVMERIDPASLQ
jgi:hypothetical protein